VNKLAGVIALVLATVLLLFSLLTVIPAPLYPLWKLRILVTECGHFIAPLLLLTPLVWRRTAMSRAASIISLVAAVLLLVPLMSAVRVLRHLPEPRPGVIRFVASLYGRGEKPVAPRALTLTARDSSRLTFYYYAPPAPPFARVHEPPLVVMIHGGGWQSGDPRQLPALTYHLVAHGYAVAAITYRFTPGSKYPAQLEDITDQLAMLRVRAAALGFDPSRIVLLGRSAGAHLALLYAYSAHDPDIDGVISFYGPTDLRWGYEHPSPPRVYQSSSRLIDFLGATPDADPGVYRDASPITYAGARTVPPTLLVHGGSDELVSFENTRRLADVLLRARHPATVVEMPWATHGCDYIVRGPCYRISRIAVDQFLERVLPL
jgi:acetyl esterase/lipase